MQQPHVDALGALCIAAELVRLQNPPKIGLALLLLCFPGSFGTYPEDVLPVRQRFLVWGKCVSANRGRGSNPLRPFSWVQFIGKLGQSLGQPLRPSQWEISLALRYIAHMVHRGPVGDSLHSVFR